MTQIQVDNIYNKEATGSPSFPLGANVTGVITATTFKGGAEITSGTISATSVTAASGTFNGPVTIGGTLTYEDVTNIDSVGVITARNGVKVTASGIDIAGGGINAVGVVTATNDIKANGNIIGDSSTNISGISSVTATTYYGSGANLGGIESAPTISGTVSEAAGISTGNAVIINSNGTISKVTESFNYAYAAGGNSQVTVDNPVLSGSCFIPSLNKIVVAYENESQGEDAYAIVGDVDESGGISWGTGTVFDTGNPNDSHMDLVWDTANEKVVIIWNDASTASVWVIIGTISGTAITFGTRVKILNGQANGVSKGLSVCYDSTNNKCVFAYKDTGDSNRPKCRVGTVSGTSISFGTEVTVDTHASNAVSVAYDKSQQKVIYTSQDTNDSHKTDTYVGTVSGTDISFGTVVTMSKVDSYNTVVTYDETNEKVIVMGGSGSDNWAAVGTISGTSVSWGAYSSTWTTESVQYNSISWDPFTKKIIVGAAGGGWQGYMNVGTVSGTSISFGTAFRMYSTAGRWATYSVTRNGHFTAVFYNNDNSGNFTSNTTKYATALTNATGENFAGFAKDSYANSATATILTTGAVTENQVGLTTGKQYYVQNNGTLGLNAGSVVTQYAGQATSATNLVINANSRVAANPGWELLLGGSFSLSSGNNGSGNSPIITEDLDTTYASYSWLKINVFAYVTNDDIGGMGVQFKYVGDGNFKTNNSYVFQNHSGSNGSDRTAGKNTSMNNATFKNMSADCFQSEAILYGANDTNVAKVWNVSNCGWRNSLGSDDVSTNRIMSGNPTTTALKGLQWYFDSIGSGQTGKCQWKLFGMK